jgi:DNA-binding transcriptional LysR family regulator
MPGGSLDTLTLHQLQVFAAVAREGSFGRAAEALLISVPSVSDQVRLLERSVGARLLERSPGKRWVALTPAGELLLQACTQLEASLTDALRQIRALPSGLEPMTVAFGASLSFGGYAFPRLYEGFHRRYPEITVNLQIGNRIEVLDGLRRGRLDCGVVLGPIDVPELTVETLGSEIEVVLAGPPGHRLAGGDRPAAFSVLAGEQFVVPGDISPISQGLMRLSTARGTRLSIGWRVGNIEAQIQAIASGVGIGPTLLEAIDRRVAAGEMSLLNVEGFPFTVQQYLMHRPGQLHGAGLAFREFLLDHAGRAAD